jgi:hypothetical protein
MSELQEWLVTLRPGAGVGDEAAALQTLLLPVPGLQLVRLQVNATGPVAIVRATRETIAQLRCLHLDRLVIARNSTLSMS